MFADPHAGDLLKPVLFHFFFCAPFGVRNVTHVTSGCSLPLGSERKYPRSNSRATKPKSEDDPLLIELYVHHFHNSGYDWAKLMQGMNGETRLTELRARLVEPVSYANQQGASCEYPVVTHVAHAISFEQEKHLTHTAWASHPRLRGFNSAREGVSS
jgi:hypothetical protein